MTVFVHGLVPDAGRASQAVDALVEARFSPSEVSVLVRREDGEIEAGDVRQRSGIPEGAATGSAVGATLGATGVALVSTGVLPGIGLLAAGPILAALEGVAAGAAGGGLFGALAGLGWWKKEAEIPADALERGEILVGVTVPEAEEERAREVLTRSGASRVQKL